MAKMTKLEMQIEAAQKRIQQEQARLKELENEQKTRNDNARTNRLCKRHGLLETGTQFTNPSKGIIIFAEQQYPKRRGLCRQGCTHQRAIENCHRCNQKSRAAIASIGYTPRSQREHQHAPRHCSKVQEAETQKGRSRPQ